MKIFWMSMAACFLGVVPSLSQRAYRANSVLSSGLWYKIGVTGSGVHKIDLPFLNKLGINTSGLSSATVRLFGNGGSMLPENPKETVIDDLQENGIWVEDGGDGILNGTDYLLFYSSGPHQWKPTQKSFKKNIYSDTAYYFLQIGGNGKRVFTNSAGTTPSLTITSYDFLYHHELDTFNFLSSGKQWFGEEFSTLPGRSLTRNFTISLPGPGPHLVEPDFRFVGRVFSSSAILSVKSGGQPLLQASLPPVGTGPYDLFAQEVKAVAAPVSVSASSISLEIQLVPPGNGGQAWLDRFTLQGRSALSFASGRQFMFRDRSSVTPGRAATFRVTYPGSLRIWDITDPQEPLNMLLTKEGNDWLFVQDVSILREYIGFSNEALLQPIPFGKIANQDLHALPAVPFIIVTVPPLRAQANRLALFHQVHDGIKSVVVNAEEVFNEFSSGIPDPTAIRDFVKMFYDRAGADSALRPKYLLLFGAGSFDYKNRISGNTNFVPAFESEESLDPLSTYTSDDYYGLLDDGDDMNGPAVPLLDIGIGRIPAVTVSEATSFVNKLIAYHDTTAFGPWRNVTTFIADDEDNDLHLQDAETISGTLNSIAPNYTIHKIYLDTYEQQSSAGGSRYPTANVDILSAVNEGTLVWNYNGHGGYRRLAEEVVLDQDVIRTFANENRLPLFITATCDVAPYDNPLISSIGEDLLLRSKTGAIALMTTTRLVFAFSNRVMNQNYLETAFKKKGDGTYPSLGEAVRNAKNRTYAFFGDPVNNRKFTLLGDPAMSLAFPVNNVRLTSVNGQPFGTRPDTLKAFSTCSMQGEVTDASGAVDGQFNGIVHATIYDKPFQRVTRGNDAGSPVTTYNEQVAPFFRGVATVKEGRFTISFVVPKDIDYRFGKGKASFYVQSTRTDGNGSTTDFLVGGTGQGADDKMGPDIRLWLNDERFTEGSLTHSQPVLLMRLNDSSGINIMGTSPGHDITAMLDGDPRQIFTLNKYYQAEKDSYRSGRVRFPLPRLTKGPHILTVKAWDAVNNSSQRDISFRVEEEERFVLENVLNYPNPFTTRTAFWFDHNRPAEPLQVSVRIFTVSGKLVKTLRETILSGGSRSNEIQWDGTDDYGSRLGRGTYLYQLKVTAGDGKNAEQWQKLYIL